MAINTGVKGRNNELKAKKLLEAAGYAVERRIRGRFTRDFYNLFDLLAVRGKDMRFVQVKSNSRETPELREAIQLFPVPDCCTKEVWVYYDRVKEPTIHVL